MCLNMTLTSQEQLKSYTSHTGDCGMGWPSLSSPGHGVVYKARTELIKNLRYYIFFPHEDHIQPLSPLLSYVFIAILFLLYPIIQHASRRLLHHFHVQTTHGLLLSHAL